MLFRIYMAFVFNPLPLSFQSDHFQAVLTSSDDGTTYVIFLYGALTTIVTVPTLYARVSKNTVCDKGGEMVDINQYLWSCPSLFALWFPLLWP